MRKFKLYHRTIAMFLVMNMLNTVVPYNLLYASNNGPKAPEAASFEPVDAADAVNLLTGDMAYVLPLLNVPSPEGGYPLSLSYHSGISMDQEASFVGLGWTLNPGAINRSVAGIPDDWKETKKYDIINDPGGVVTSYSGGVSVGWGDGLFSAGLYASYTENKTFGGENTYSFDGGLTGSIGFKGTGLGVGGSIGLSGASVGVGYKALKGDNGNLGFSISASQSFKGDGTAVGIGASYSAQTESLGALQHGSVGISLNSRSGLGISTAFTSASIGGGNNLSTDLNFDNDNFGISIPIYAVNINFAYNRSRYWLYENDYTTYNGTLYAGNTDETLAASPFDEKIGFDGYESLYKADRLEQLRESNFTNLGYDIYNVSGQGISGSIKPYILEEGAIHGHRQMIQGGGFGQPTVAARYFNPTSLSNRYNKTVDNNANDIQFYFDNEYSSYVQVKSNGWNTPVSGTNYSNIYQLTTKDKEFDFHVPGEGSGYNFQAKRLKKGNYIETYTNAEILAQPGLIIHPTTYINRSSSLVPADGIGAYKVTTTDGKTYHYSLPVYQREQINRSSPLDKNIATHFSERQQFKPYATHWLLTAITGPDYFDKNGDSRVNGDDHGYWVVFDYGKWSDGFTWRMPAAGEEENDRVRSYSWGVKDIYYLDKVFTRTHTALFVKSVREDDQSAEINRRNGSNPINFEDIHIRSFVEGEDGKVYFNGVYDDIEVPWPPAYHYLESRHKEYVETKKQRSLKLDKIILLKNDLGQANAPKTNAGQSAPIFAGKIDISQFLQVQHLTTGPKNSKNVDVHDRTWRAEYFGNVLDAQDMRVNLPDIEQKALKVIEFGYDSSYPLAGNSPNSAARSKGRLTLSQVQIKGKRGVAHVPPYKFHYYNEGGKYDKDRKDDWGYYQNVPMTWSLDEITTPTGAKLQIEYESDSFDKEAASNTRYFDQNLELKFTGVENGYKTVVFRNHRDNESGENIDFTDFFAVNQTSKLDVQYWLNPSHNGDHRNADVGKDCMVEAVTPTTVTFRLPDNSVNNDVRRDNTCRVDNWVFYRWYSEVVGNTAGFAGAVRDNDCGGPGNGNYKLRYRIYANKYVVNKQGGGVRVKQLHVVDENNHKLTTRYTYNVPGTTTSSGITSYAPSRNTKEVRHVTEMPSPFVMYEYVNVQNTADGELVSRDLYHFNVLKPMQESLNSFSVGDIISMKTDQSLNYEFVKIDGKDTRVKLVKKTLVDQTAALGRLISKETYNNRGQLLSKTTNEYLSYEDMKQGLVGETTNSYKRISGNVPKDEYHLVSSFRVKVPNVLKSTTTTAGGITTTTYFDKHNFLTGQVTETRIYDSEGNKFKTKIVPAYKKYQEMGAKSENVAYKNMLDQEAASYSYLYDEADANKRWKEVGIGLSTWKPWNNDIWRKHKTYTWQGDIDDKGVFQDFNSANDDGFDWSRNATTQPEKWLKLAEVTKYNDYSIPVESEDINGNKASTKMDYKSQYILATGNAGHHEMFYSGAEDPGRGIFGGGVAYGNGSTVVSTFAHTGANSLRTTVAGQAYKVNVVVTGSNAATPLPPKYKASVWAHKSNYANTRLMVGGQTIAFNPGEVIKAGDWVQLNFDFSLTTHTDIYVTTTAGTAYFDDFRLHPLHSTMTSYVHNQWGEMSHILGTNNMATRYEYDEAGRLVRTFAEVEDLDTEGSGGFKMISENEYTYKRKVGEATEPLVVSLEVGFYPDNRLGFIAYTSGGSGEYEYRWATGPSVPELNYGPWQGSNEYFAATSCAPGLTTTHYRSEVRDRVTGEIVVESGSYVRTNCGDCQGLDCQPDQTIQRKTTAN